MERKTDVSSVIAAFALGVAFGYFGSAVRNVDRWLGLDRDRHRLSGELDERYDLLTNYFDNRIDPVVNAVTNAQQTINEIKLIVDSRRRGGVAVLQPRDGGEQG